eukprot:scaffold194320_cov19-Prasinocladus_malaysianus.AAC.1
MQAHGKELPEWIDADMLDQIEQIATQRITAIFKSGTDVLNLTMARLLQVRGHMKRRQEGAINEAKSEKQHESIYTAGAGSRALRRLSISSVDNDLILLHAFCAAWLVRQASAYLLSLLFSRKGCISPRSCELPALPSKGPDAALGVRIVRTRLNNVPVDSFFSMI